jgi:hypothetical protein
MANHVKIAGNATDVVATVLKDTSGNGVLLFHEAAENALDALDNKKVNITRREPAFVQTHNAVTVALNGSNSSAVQTTAGYDQLAIAAKSDANHTWKIELQWYADAATTVVCGYETLGTVTTNNQGAFRTTVKAPYFKTVLANSDGASAHVMSSWTTLLP